MTVLCGPIPRQAPIRSCPPSTAAGPTVDRRTPRMRSACSLAWNRRRDPRRDMSPEAGVGHAPRLSRRRLSQGRRTQAWHQRIHLPPAGLAADQTCRGQERSTGGLATAAGPGGRDRRCPVVRWRSRFQDHFTMPTTRSTVRSRVVATVGQPPRRRSLKPRSPSAMNSRRFPNGSAA